MDLPHSQKRISYYTNLMNSPILYWLSVAKILLMLVMACGLAWLVGSKATQAVQMPLMGGEAIGAYPMSSFALVAMTSPGNAIPISAGNIPKFSHVIVIVMENKEYGEVIRNNRMPNFNRWAKQYTLLTSYYAITHPSLPNYIALVAGDIFGIHSDCTDCFVNARSLPDLLEASGRSWKGYLESLPSAGFTGSRSGNYAKKHNPFLYFDAIRNDPARCQRSLVPLTQLAIDLEQDKLPDFVFIVPNLCNSSHDCGLEVTDAWLGKVVNSIVQSPAFDQNSLLVLTFDEGTTNLGCCGSPHQANGGRIATILISSLVKMGYQDTTPYSHYSLLKTIAVAWDLEELGHASDLATNLIALPWQQ